MSVQTQPLAREICDGMARADVTDQLADYVSRGRAYHGMDTDWLRQRWVTAFRSWFAAMQEVAASYQLVADIRAELSLRDEKPPYEAVQADLEQARQHALESGPNGSRAMERQLEAYLLHGLPTAGNA